MTSDQVNITPAELVRFIRSREGLRTFLREKQIKAPEHLAMFMNGCKDQEALLAVADHIGELFNFDVEGEYWKLKGKNVVKVSANYNEALGKFELQIQFKISLDGDTDEKSVKDLFSLLAQIDSPSGPAPKTDDHSGCPICDAASASAKPKAEVVRLPQTISAGILPSMHFDRDAAPAPKTTRYFIVPVKNFTNGFGMQIIQKSILGGSWGFDDRVNNRIKPRAGDKICFYLTQDGVVAQGEIGEKMEPSKNRFASKTDLYPNRYKLQGMLLGKVIKVKDVVDSLDFFDGHRVKNYGLLVKDVRLISEHDFSLLTGVEKFSHPLVASEVAPH